MQGKVQAIIVGNEPNLSYEWGYRPTQPADYVALLQDGLPGRQSGQSRDAGAGRSAGPNPGTGRIALGPERPGVSCSDVYDAGAAPYFDGLAVHVYGLTFPPEAEPDPDVLNFRRVELMRDVMVPQRRCRNAAWSLPRPAGTTIRAGPRPYGRPSAYSTRSTHSITHETHWPFVELIGLWSFRYPAPTRSYMDYFTLVTPEFVTKPIYDALRDYTGNGQR